METSGIPRSIPTSYANSPAVRRAPPFAALGAASRTRAGTRDRHGNRRRPSGIFEERSLGSALNLCAPVYLEGEIVRAPRRDERYAVDRRRAVDH